MSGAANYFGELEWNKENEQVLAYDGSSSSAFAERLSSVEILMRIGDLHGTTDG